MTNGLLGAALGISTCITTLSTQYSRVNKEAMVPMLTPPHHTQQKHVTHSLNLYPRPATEPTM